MLATAQLRRVDGFGPHPIQSSESHPYIRMPSSKTNPRDSSNAISRRVPRLAVRNRTPDEATAIEASQSSDDSAGEPQPNYTRLAQLSSDPAFKRVSSDLTLRADRHHQRTDSVDSQSRARKPDKRKSAGVLGFFTLKEPSTSALEDFAEHEKKRAAQKSARSSAGVIPVSSQKLPDYVPKVNSKWNGLPETTKSNRRSSDFREKDAERGGSKRNSTISLVSNSYGDLSRRPFGSLSSKPTIRQSLDKKRSSVHVTEVGGWRSDNSVHTLPPTKKHPPVSRAELEHAEPLQVPPLCHSNGQMTSPEASPTTPALELAMPHFDSDVQLTASPGLLDPHFGRESSYFSDSDEVVVQTAGPDVLGRPATSLRQISDQSTSTKSSTFDSTIDEEIEYSPSVQSKRTLPPGADAPSVVRNFSHVSRYCSRASSTSRYSALSSSVATSQLSYSTLPITTSTNAAANRATSMSPKRRAADLTSVGSDSLPVQRRSLPKEQVTYSVMPKIGKKSDVLPWEAFEPPEDIAPRVAISTYVSKKPKRLSYKLGKK